MLLEQKCGPIGVAAGFFIGGERDNDIAIGTNFSRLRRIRDSTSAASPSFMSIVPRP
jgi:hypothetical protein